MPACPEGNRNHARCCHIDGDFVALCDFGRDVFGVAMLTLEMQVGPEPGEWWRAVGWDECMPEPPERAYARLERLFRDGQLDAMRDLLVEMQELSRSTFRQLRRSRMKRAG